MSGPEGDPYKAPDADLDVGAIRQPAGPVTRLNPWFSIWTRPRDTIRQIVDTDPTYFVVAITMLAGIGSALDRASYRSMGDKVELSYILIIALIAGPIIGILTLYVGAWLVQITGRWLGGKATAEHLRAAMAWPAVTALVGLALWVPQLVLFGEEMFTTETPNIESSMILMVLLLAFALASIILMIWGVVLTAKCVAQVQGFSAWRGLGNLVLGGLLLIVPVMVIGVVLLLAFG